MKSLSINIILLLMLSSLTLSGRETADSASLNAGYRQSWAEFDAADRENAQVKAFIRQWLNAGQGRDIIVTGSASPEGIYRWLQPLASRRACHLQQLLLNGGIAPEVIVMGRTDVDWTALRDSILNDRNVPYRADLLELLTSVPRNNDENLRLAARLKAVGQGEAWDYIFRFFPALRYARAAYRLPAAPPSVPSFIGETVIEVPRELAYRPVVTQKRGRNCYWALKSNLIHDALLVPNIGLEWYVGKGLSIEADYSGAWWGNKYRTHLWRYYGGNLQLNYYFAARRNVAQGYTPFRGWHVGVYGEAASYDFQFGRRGYQGRWAGGGGVVGGYTVPLNKHFSLDLFLGLGFFGGRYKVCRYMDGHEVWIETRQRRWWGPTRVGVTLSWLLGKKNNNRPKIKKGGAL